MTAPDPKSVWRQYLKENRTPDLAVAVAGTVTLEPLVPFLGAHLAEKKLNPAITVGPFGQVQQLCRDYKSVLGAGKFDVIAVIWRVEDLFPAQLAACLDDGAALPALLNEIRSFAEGVAQLRRDFAGTLIVSTPPYPAMPGYALTEPGQATAGIAVHNAVQQLWAQEMAKIARLRLLDLHGLLLYYGFKNAHDARKWQLYRQPYAEGFWQDAGRALGRIIAAEKISPKKCIVLDLDNTLWGGIVGEDGIEGLQLGDEFPGRAFRDFQRSLMHLKSRGVLLAVASKNNPDDAYEVFDKHDAMVLTRKDIVHFEIHWESKVESIKRIAQKINIGLDSLVFVDDNPKEIGEMQERLPEVTCVLVPEELAELPALLDRFDYFDVAEITDEDRKRTEMLVTDNVRQQLQDTMSEEEFRKSLQLKITVFAAEKQHIARVTQLINKSNQFNLTTRRRTQDEVETLAQAKDAYVLGMDIKDKYGDYGLVGVAVLKKQGAACIIDTLLMSCRVLGRGAEETFIAKVAEAAKSLGCTELRGKYIPTAKNAMVKDLYARFEFTHDAKTDDWVLQLSSAPSAPAHIDASLRLKAG